ncbi:hypothetical protein C8J57DRAFT_142370 [Mycena rebaudengoi]|nr:hypothetical protein C8J57DRAFT_142370 [Mycena rebaudengoi]
MPSRTKAVLREISDGALLCATVLFCGPCLAYLFCCTNPIAPRVARNPPTRMPYPTPLPTRRIDIRRKEIKPQPRSCHLLNLPAELRQLVFELALGHRVVALTLVPNKSRSRLRVHAAFHREITGLPPYPPGLFTQHPDDKIPVTFLRVCRQVYLEGTESMHRSNTYYSDFYDFQWIVLGGLGLHCLPHIRRVRMTVNRRGVDHSYPDSECWYSVCQLLKQAGIEHLTLKFAYAYPYYDPFAYNSLDEDWCSSLLEVRGLRTLDIGFECEIPSGYSVVEVCDQFRALMIGPEADERYHAFLDGKRLKEQEAQAVSEAKSSTGAGPQ